jgi:MFS transporter, FSR family, fosmidomycin resistance protein
VGAATAERHDSTTDAQPHYLRLSALGWLHFLNDGAANYLPGVLPVVLVAVGLGTGYAGTVMSALLIGQSLQVFSGWLADRIGGRALLVTGLVGSSLGAAGIGWAPSASWLIASLLAIGISNSLFHPQALSGARDLSGSRPGFGISLFLVGGEVGRGLWPLIASLVVLAWGRHSLWLLGLPALASIVALWPAMPVQPRRPAHLDGVDWHRHVVPRLALIGFSTLRALAIFGSVTYLPVLWHQQGRPMVDGAGAIATLLVVGIIGNVGGGHLADRWGRRTVMVASSLLGAALFAAFGWTVGAWTWVLLGMLGIALFASLPLSVLTGQDLFPGNRSLGSGMALGLSNGLAALALLALDPLARTHGVNAVFWLLALALLAAAMLSLAALPGARNAQS